MSKSEFGKKFQEEMQSHIESGGKRLLFPQQISSHFNNTAIPLAQKKGADMNIGEIMSKFRYPAILLTLS